MHNNLTVLIADDEAPMRKNLREVLSEEGYAVIEAQDGEEALRMAIERKPDLMLLDIRMPKLDGMQVLNNVKKKLPHLPVIIFTAFGTSERPIEAMKTGAYDYVEKPFDLEELLLVIRRAIEYAGMQTELKELRSEISNSERLSENLVGTSGKMQSIFKMVGKVANSDATVLIQGESGSGKEVIADAIQRYSNRKDKPFIKVNCGALPESLLESELFGHEAGAFTGALKQRKGRFELANEGTFFLDEIDNMPHSLQVKLLRILQNKTFERVGGEQTIKVNTRIISATNKNLEDEVKAGRFREDLYYRLNIIFIKVPPLREHPQDIPALVEHFLKKYGGDTVPVVSDRVMDILMKQTWPGNIRELENVIQRAIVLSHGDVITREHLPPQFRSHSVPDEEPIPALGKTSLKNMIAKYEEKLVLKALMETDWNQTKAAELLQVNRRQLFTKMKQYKLKK